MKTATFHSSLFVSLLAGLVACGGGGEMIGDEPDSYSEEGQPEVVVSDTPKAGVSNICTFSSVEDMRRAIAAGVICRQYVVDSGAV